MLETSKTHNKKPIVSEINYSLGGFDSRLYKTKDKSKELVYKSIGNTQFEAQEGKSVEKVE